MGLVACLAWGILLAYLVGKPLGIVVAASALGGRGRLGLTRDELRATALSSGVGFTLSLLIASRAFEGAQLDQAKLGLLATALLAPALTAAALATRGKGRRSGVRRARSGRLSTSPCAA
jgi:Na+/H+ antiporter NhaA